MSGIYRTFKKIVIYLNLKLKAYSIFLFAKSNNLLLFPSNVVTEYWRHLSSVTKLARCWKEIWLQEWHGNPGPEILCYVIIITSTMLCSSNKFRMSALLCSLTWETRRVNLCSSQPRIPDLQVSSRNPGQFPVLFRTGEICGEASATFIPYTDLTKASHTRKLLIHDLKFQFPSPTLALWELPNLPNTHHQVSYQIIGPKRLPILVNEHWSGISLFNFKKHSKSQKHLASIFFKYMIVGSIPVCAQY